jgi:hypothetical protein
MPTRLQAIRAEVEVNFKRLFKDVSVSASNAPVLSDFAYDLENTARAIRRRVTQHREKRAAQAEGQRQQGR